MEATNPISQLARMYQLVEKALRQRAHSVPELRKIEEIAALEKSPYQVRDICKTLAKHKYVRESGTRLDKRFVWEPGAPSYTLPLKMDRRSRTAPSAVKVERPPIHQKPDAIEVEFAGVVITIGRNPDSGNIRLVIDGK